MPEMVVQPAVDVSGIAVRTNNRTDMQPGGGYISGLWQPGKYLRFSRQGDMPQVVTDCWQAVWAYFADADCPHRRRFTTDYEYYRSDEQVDTYIAVDEPTENVCA